MEREGGDRGDTDGEEDGNGDGDGSREGSIRRRGKKKKMVGRKLMPLILVEEGRLKKEIEMAEEEENQGMARVVNDVELGSRLGFVAAGGDKMEDGWRSSVEIRAGIGGAVEVITPPATPFLPDLSTRTGTPPSSSKWNWWNRKVPHAQSKPIASLSELDLRTATRADVWRSLDDVGNIDADDSIDLRKVKGMVATEPSN